MAWWTLRGVQKPCMARKRLSCRSAIASNCLAVNRQVCSRGQVPADQSVDVLVGTSRLGLCE